MSISSFNDTPTAHTNDQQLALLEEKHRDLVKRIRTLSEETRAQQQLIRTLFDFTPFGLVLFDEDRRLIQVNKAGQGLLRKNQVALIGKSCEHIFNCYETANTCPLSESVPSLDKQETKCRTCNDCGQTYLRSAVVTRSGDKHIILEAFIDISQIKQAEQAKNDFLAKMSHELRTPLNVISGFIELLRDELPASSSETGLDYLNIMNKASRDLEHIIDELMDVAKIRGNNIHLDMHAISVAELVLQMEQEIRNQSNYSDLLSVSIDSKVETVFADPKRLKQILSQLLLNAFKYGNNSRVQLNVIINDNCVEFIVSDQGYGMTDDQLQRVFNEFEQGDNSITRQFGGVGLGLSIAHHFTRLMGGELTIQSRPQEGTRVCLSLPIKPV